MKTLNFPVVVAMATASHAQTIDGRTLRVSASIIYRYRSYGDKARIAIGKDPGEVIRLNLETMTY